ncbi:MULTISPECIES: hypothetical protein [unclassified Streptomyces]|uniref:hypothetical protein n=1 Tax=unclassified Streptomyces TaxID=2593676 RepID=UPI00278C4F90|nr:MULTISPECIES: hypothetical protein [unclassified Streptomyces]
MTPVELPAPSPALRVHEAAARIRRIADRAACGVATNSYWSVGWERGVTNAIGGDEGDLAALLTPELAVEVADWLDARAAANVRFGEPMPALALKFVEAVQP